MKMPPFATEGKIELRAACKAAGVKGYGNMTNEGMRIALSNMALLKSIAQADTDKLNAEAAALAETATAAELDTARDAALAALPGKGLKIEPNREKRNGVTRPSTGGKCRAIWDALDEYNTDPANEGEKPTAAVIKAIGAEEGWDKTTTMIQFYQWRKFNGITGRSK